MQKLNDLRLGSFKDEFILNQGIRTLQQQYENILLNYEEHIKHRNETLKKQHQELDGCMQNKYAKQLEIIDQLIQNYKASIEAFKEVKIINIYENNRLIILQNKFTLFISAKDNTVENRNFLDKFMKKNYFSLTASIDDFRILFYSTLFENCAIPADNSDEQSVPLNLQFLLNSIPSLEFLIEILKPYGAEAAGNFKFIQNKFQELLQQNIMNTEQDITEIYSLAQLEGALKIDEQVLDNYLKGFLTRTTNNLKSDINKICLMNSLELILAKLSNNINSCFANISSIKACISITNIVCGNTETIDQGDTNLCGIDVLTRYMAINSPYIFAKLALSLLAAGKAQYNDLKLTAHNDCLQLENDFAVAFMSSIKNANSTFGYSKYNSELIETLIGVTPPNDLLKLFNNLGFKIQSNTLRLTHIEKEITSFFLNMFQKNNDTEKDDEINKLIVALNSSKGNKIPIMLDTNKMDELETTQYIIRSGAAKHGAVSLGSQYNCCTTPTQVNQEMHLLLNKIGSFNGSVHRSSKYYPMIPHYVCLTSCELDKQKKTISFNYESTGNLYKANLTIEQFAELFLGYIHPVLEYPLDARLEKEEQKKLMLFSAGLNSMIPNKEKSETVREIKNKIISTYLKL